MLPACLGAGEQPLRKKFKFHLLNADFSKLQRTMAVYPRHLLLRKKVETGGELEPVFLGNARSLWIAEVTENHPQSCAM